MCHTPSNKSKYDGFGRFLGTVEKTQKEKFAPGIYLHLCNQSTNLNVTILVLRMRFANMYIFGPKTDPLQ